MCERCGLCGEEKHTYSYTFESGETRESCGAYAAELPGWGAEDLPAIESLLREQHGFFERLYRL